jgi:hypothetical protein
MGSLAFYCDVPLPRETLNRTEVDCDSLGGFGGTYSRFVPLILWLPGLYFGIADQAQRNPRQTSCQLCFGQMQRATIDAKPLYLRQFPATELRRQSAYPQRAGAR